MLLTILQVAVLIVLAFVVITQVLRPAFNGDRIFPAFRKPEKPNVPGTGGNSPGNKPNETKDVQ